MKNIIIVGIHFIMIACVCFSCATKPDKVFARNSVIADNGRDGNLFDLDASLQNVVVNIHKIKIPMLIGEVLDYLGKPKSIHDFQNEKTIVYSYVLPPDMEAVEGVSENLILIFNFENDKLMDARFIIRQGTE